MQPTVLHLVLQDTKVRPDKHLASDTTSSWHGSVFLMPFSRNFVSHIHTSSYLPVVMQNKNFV